MTAHVHISNKTRHTLLLYITADTHCVTLLGRGKWGSTSCCLCVEHLTMLLLNYVSKHNVFLLRRMETGCVDIFITYLSTMLMQDRHYYHGEVMLDTDTAVEMANYPTLPVFNLLIIIHCALLLLLLFLWWWLSLKRHNTILIIYMKCVENRKYTVHTTQILLIYAQNYIAQPHFIPQMQCA